jgi:hypothetical protein
MPTADVTTIVRTLIAALPDACLRDFCIQLALSLATSPPATATSSVEPSARRKGGWPRGRPRRSATNGRRRGTGAPAKAAELAERRARYAAARKAKRRAAKAQAAAKAPPPTAGNGSSGAKGPVTAQAFWQRCEQIEPAAPWHIPVREFGVRDAVAQQAFRARTIPPRIGPMALSRFLELQVS